jgi:hypothetical protein
MSTLSTHQADKTSTSLKPHSKYQFLLMQLRRREDLLSFYGMELVFPERDLVTIDIPMECSTPLVFCLAKKKELKNLK